MEGQKKLVKKRNKIYLLIVFLLILSVVLFALSLFLTSDQGKVLDTKELEASLSIGDHTGFDVSKDRLGFGMITEGSKATREDILVKNNYNFPIYLEFNTEGNISEFLVYNDFIYLEPGEEKNISISTIVIGDEAYGDYIGKFKIVFKGV